LLAAEFHTESHLGLLVFAAWAEKHHECLLYARYFMAVVEGGGKEGPPDLVVQLLAYWMECCPTWQAFKKDALKNNSPIGQQCM
jgi:hypothetical protein